MENMWHIQHISGQSKDCRKMQIVAFGANSNEITYGAKAHETARILIFQMYQNRGAEFVEIPYDAKHQFMDIDDDVWMIFELTPPVSFGISICLREVPPISCWMLKTT